MREHAPSTGSRAQHAAPGASNAATTSRQSDASASVGSVWPIIARLSESSTSVSASRRRASAADARAEASSELPTTETTRNTNKREHVLRVLDRQLVQRLDEEEVERQVGDDGGEDADLATPRSPEMHERQQEEQEALVEQPNLVLEAAPCTAVRTATTPSEATTPVRRESTHDGVVIARV